MSSYEALVRQLFNVSRFSGMKLGLTNTEKLAALLGMPHTKFRSVHVTGTNGKGSVCTKIASGLQMAGLKVGLYTSPHISSFRERVSINGELISEQEVVLHLSRVMSLAQEHNIPATFFELTTLMAFCHFAQRNVEYAVVEVGIGGRLDATNIISPDLSVLTSIGLDHTDILGPTVEHITREKSGIIKQNAPAVIGPSVPRDIVREV
jgi:dihydrofolate synthase/folylpolyglutamate synthase